MKQRCPNEKCREDVRYPLFYREEKKGYQIDEYGNEISGTTDVVENEDYCGICGEELVDDDEEEE